VAAGTPPMVAALLPPSTPAALLLLQSSLAKSMFGLSRLISSRTTLFNLPVEHYSSYQPNILKFLPPSSILPTQPRCCLVWRRRRQDLGAPNSGPRGLPAAASTTFDGGTRGHGVKATSVGRRRDQWRLASSVSSCLGRD
jgi:hypothetical protein